MRRIIAKRSHGAVIIRLTPLAEQIREAIYQHLCARFLCISEKQFFSRFLAPAVFAVVSADQSCLNRGRKHHGAFVFMLFQRIQKRGGKTEISFSEFGGIFRTVHPRQIKDEIRFFAVFIQFFRRTVEIVFVHRVDMQSGTSSVFAVFNVFQSATKILSDKTFCARYQYFHITSRCFPLSSSQVRL